MIRCSSKEGMPDRWSCFPEFLNQSPRRTLYQDCIDCQKEANFGDSFDT